MTFRDVAITIINSLNSAAHIAAIIYDWLIRWKKYGLIFVLLNILEEPVLWWGEGFLDLGGNHLKFKLV